MFSHSKTPPVGAFLFLVPWLQIRITSRWGVGFLLHRHDCAFEGLTRRQWYHSRYRCGCRFCLKYQTDSLHCQKTSAYIILIRMSATFGACILKGQKTTTIQLTNGCGSKLYSKFLSKRLPTAGRSCHLPKRLPAKWTKSSRTLLVMASLRSIQ